MRKLFLVIALIVALNVQLSATTVNQHIVYASLSMMLIKLIFEVKL